MNTISRIASAIATGISKACQTVANTAKTFIAKVRGDPVLLTSGRYIQNDIDITLKNFSSSINISRYYIARISSFSKNLQKKRKPLKFVLPNKKIKGIRLCMNKFYL